MVESTSAPSHATAESSSRHAVERAELEQRCLELASENATLRRSSMMRDDLIRIVLEGKGIVPIMDRLAALLDNSVAVADPFFHFIASSPPGEHGDHHRRQSIAQGGTARELLDDPLVGAYFRKVAEQKSSVIFPPFPEHGMEQRRLMAPILAGRDIIGYVTVLEDRHVFEEFHATILQQATLFLALELMKQRVAQETELSLITDFLGDLFSGSYGSREAVVSRAGFLGADLFRQWILLLVDADDIDALGASWRVEHPVAARHKLFGIVRRAAESRFPGSIVVVQSESIVILCPVASHPLSNGENAKGLAEALREQVRRLSPEVTMSVAIGGVCAQVEDFGPCYAKAKRALGAIRGLGRQNQTVTLEDLGIYGILFRREEPDELIRFAHRMLDPLLEYDQKRGTNLAETIEIYLSENGAFRSTARRLFVHHNTLRGRLERISELCQLDLQSAENRLNLQIALEVYRLQHHSRANG